VLVQRPGSRIRSTEGVEVKIIWAIHPRQSGSLWHVECESIIKVVRLALHHQDVVGEDQVLLGWAGNQRFSAGDHRPSAVRRTVKPMGPMQVLVAGIIVLGVELAAES